MSEVKFRFVASDEGVVSTFRAIGAAADQASRRVKKGAGDAAGAIKSESKSTAEARRIKERYHAEQRRLLAREVAEFKRAEKTKEREAERAARYVTQIRRRYFEQQSRDSNRAFKAEQDARRRRRETSLGAVSSLALGAAGTAAAVGAGIVGASAREALQLNELANRASINARLKPGQSPVSAAQLASEYSAAAIATPGIGAADIAEAALQFQSLTGDLDTARKSIGDFATLASASGASIQDIATEAAAISTQFGVTDSKELLNVLSTLVVQGKQGAFEQKDAAGLMQRIAASGASFGLDKGANSAKTIGGLLQIAMGGTGSAELSATGLERVFSSITSHTKENGKIGDTSIYDAKGNMRDIVDILPELIANTGGSNAAAKKKGLGTLFGEQGIRAVNPLIATFLNVSKNTTGTEAEKTAAGLKALREQIQGSIQVTNAEEIVKQDATQAQEQITSNLRGMWESVVSASQPLVGEFGAFTDKFSDLLKTTLPGIKTAFEVLSASVWAATWMIGQMADLIDTVFPPSADELSKRRQRATEKELRSLEDKQKEAGGPLGLTPSEAKRLETLRAAHMQDIGGGKVQTLSREEFEKQFAAASDSKWKDNQMWAGMTASTIASRGWADESGMNQKQKTLAQDYAAQLMQAKMQEESAKKIDSAAIKFNMAADKLSGGNGQGNVFGNGQGMFRLP